MADAGQTQTRRRSSRAAVAAAVLSLLLLAITLLALPQPAAGQDGFLFRAPEAALTLRVGPLLYTARSDVFDAFREELTLERGDFRAPAAGLDLVFMALPRLDVVLGIGYAQASPRSEFREWIDDRGDPIEQVTRLQSVPLTATLRYLPMARGRAVASTAWLPASTVPYVGAGGGVAWYRLRQTGDFVDSRDRSIFSDTIESSGWQGIVHALAGVDHWLTPRLGVNAEARYTYGRAAADEGFRSFDRLDVGGVQASLGFSVRW